MCPTSDEDKAMMKREDHGDRECRKSVSKEIGSGAKVYQLTKVLSVNKYDVASVVARNLCSGTDCEFPVVAAREHLRPKHPSVVPINQYDSVIVSSRPTLFGTSQW